MNTNLSGVTRTKTSSCDILNSFSRYKPEEEKKVRKFEVKEDKTLKLKDIFRGYKIGLDFWNKYHENTLSLIKGIKYIAKDVTNFSISLAEFQDEEDFGERAGIFLSTLINNCKEQNFTIITEHISQPIPHLGDQNTKNIIVEGNAGNWVGWEMKKGCITVEGNAGWGVGRWMEGGMIHLEGDYKSLYNTIVGGDIYHKGKLIVKNGKKWVMTNPAMILNNACALNKE